MTSASMQLYLTSMTLCREMVVSANALNLQHLEELYLAMELPRPRQEKERAQDEVTLDTFASIMHRLDKEMQQMQALQDHEDVAVMRLDVTAMKASMSPVPEQRLKAIKVGSVKIAYQQ
jgi:hypothetical protein